MIAYDDIGQQTKVDFDYDQYGNVVNKREYGYQISSTWKVRRRTHYTYVNWEPYLSQYIRNRVSESDVYDALQNTNDADDVPVGKTVAGYDSYSAMGGMENYGGSNGPLFLGTTGPGIGDYARGTEGARIEAILHEVAHNIVTGIDQNGGYEYLIPNDERDSDKSGKNTDLISEASLKGGFQCD